MSPSPDNNNKRTIRAPTDIPTAEIFALDEKDTVVARGVKTLQADLAPGIYQLWYRVGEKVADKIIAVRPGTGIMEVPPPELPIDTPAPVSPTAGDVWSVAIDDWSGTVDKACGAGCHIFVFVNQIGSPTLLEKQTIGGIKLRTFDGVEIGALSSGRSRDGCLAIGVEVDPGCYLLQIQDGSDRPVEQTIVACLGWQTQLFFRPVAGAHFTTLDLSQCAVRMRSIKSGLNSSNQMFRWTEAARLSLANRRASAAPVETLQARNQAVTELRESGLDPDTLDDILHAKFGNPMLGIYGGHLLLLNPEPNRDLLLEVVTNLQKLVGPHPDVMALSLYLDPNSQTMTFPQPPMLRSSWDLIVQHANRPGSGLVPPGSYSFKIGGHLHGSGAALAWRLPQPEAELATAETSVDWGALYATIADLAVSAPEKVRVLLNRDDLTPAERITFGHLAAAAFRTATAKLFSSEADRDSRFRYLIAGLRYVYDSALVRDTESTVAQSIDPEYMSKCTGIPYVALESTGRALMRKLNVQRSSSLLHNAVGDVARKAVGDLAKRIGLGS